MNLIGTMFVCVWFIVIPTVLIFSYKCKSGHVISTGISIVIFTFAEFILTFSSQKCCILRKCGPSIKILGVKKKPFCKFQGSKPTFLSQIEPTVSYAN